MKISDNKLCGLCNNHKETIKHLFLDCTKSKLLWEAIRNWILESTGIIFSRTKIEILLGYTLKESLNLPINTILLATKYYIFQCSYQGVDLNILTLKHKLKYIYNEQLALARTQFKEPDFSRKWSRYCNMMIEN